MSVCLCQTVGFLKQTMTHAMTSSKQTHDISYMTHDISVEKPPLATESLFELGNWKNEEKKHFKKFPEFALWVIWETIHMVSHQPSSAATVKADDT